jgi:hypothetical protein
MTLKERLFDAVFDNAYEFKKENVIPQCEQVADEFAIEFAEWLIKRETKYFESLKELLEIYKKGL